MDESIKCECGHSAFWWLGDRVRCTKCYSEMKQEDGNTYVRSFNADEGNTYGPWRQVFDV